MARVSRGQALHDKSFHQSPGNFRMDCGRTFGKALMRTKTVFSRRRKIPKFRSIAVTTLRWLGMNQAVALPLADCQFSSLLFERFGEVNHASKHCNVTKINNLPLQGTCGVFCMILPKNKLVLTNKYKNNIFGPCHPFSGFVLRIRDFSACQP
jgi:hypothetical protein